MFEFGVVQHMYLNDILVNKRVGQMFVCLWDPKGTKGYMFYDPKDQKVFVSTNARFLEEDYMIDNKPT